MRELVIGDMHFGIKSNSVEWLNKQCELLNTQVTKIVKEGMEFIGNSNHCAGINIRKGVSNIANAVNPRPDIKFYG